MTLGMFYLGWKLSGSPVFGALAGFTHTLNMQQVFFEANLLSETLATFLVFACLLGAYFWMKPGASKPWSLAFGIGAAASLAGLVRAQFFFLPVWLAVWLAFINPGRIRRPDLRSLVGVLLPCLLLIGGWVVFIYNHYGMVSLSTMNGYHMVQHTGAFFEYVPDEYRQIRDTYIQYREERIARYGTQGNTIWEAIPELEKVSGLNFYDLSRTLSKISVQLIREHPDLYLQSAASGWCMFWRGPVYWSAENVASPALRSILSGFKVLTQAGLFAANLLFLATSILALVSKQLRSLWKIPPFLTLTAATIWLSSLVQTLLDHGDNPRFLVPLQTMTLLWVIWVGWQTWQHFRKQPLQQTSQQSLK
jgi:hypothetical protein